MRRAKLRAAPTPSMLHRSGNSPSHPSEIFHRPTIAACSSRCGQAPARDPAEPDCDRSEAQISRSPGFQSCSHSVRCAPSWIPLTRTILGGFFVALIMGSSVCCARTAVEQITKSGAIFARLKYAAIILAVCRPRLLRGLSWSFRPGSFQLDFAWRSR